MARSYPVLRPDEQVHDRPFTEPERTRDEARIMRETLALQRGLAQRWVDHAPEPGPGHIRETDAGGHRHVLSVPDVPALLEGCDMTAVGFFGQAREDVDHQILFDLEDELLRAEACTLGEAGLLSHYSVELGGGRYGNVILFSTPDVPPEFARSELHNFAIRISPRHFHSIRLHKGKLPGPFVGDGDIVIETTKYVAFDADGVWKAVRTF
jgi:hypothetical protein